MRFLLLICDDPAAEPYRPEDDTIVDWVAENDRRGLSVLGDRLRPVEDARTVRVRSSQLLVTDGPFAETQETIAGFDVLECASLDEALERAAAHPMARFGRVEVRPTWPLDL
ncbi:MAG: YciI family protein [Cellulomonas sp.]